MSSGPVDWKKEQSKDQTIKKSLPAVRAKKKPKVVADMTSQEKMMLAQFDKLVLRDEILYRRIINPVGEETFQLVLPETFREQAVRGLHDDLGHMGVERVVGLARQRFYWPKMVFQIEDWISHCLRCVSRKTTQKIAAPLVNITTSFPLELVCMDFLKLEPDRSGYQYILVITDNFSRYAQAVPTRDNSSRTVARVLWEQYFLHYGIPERLHSDQGREFDNNLIKGLSSLLGVSKSRTTSIILRAIHSLSVLIAPYLIC